MRRVVITRFIEDLGADSIGLMELVMKFEEKLKLKRRKRL
jgi:acyl carrier protein